MQNDIKKFAQKDLFLIYCLFLFILISSCSDPVDPIPPPQPTDIIQYTYSIINRYPHQQDAFTQGLYYTNGHLLESTGLYGQSSLRRVDLESGAVLQKTDLKNYYFAEGITLWNNRIYQLTWKSYKGFIYEPSTFTVLDSFTYNTEGWGLTHNDNHLIMSDGSSFLSFRSPDNFEELYKIEVTADGNPVEGLNELEFIEGKIYANIWLTDTIAIIDPSMGQVTGWIDLTGILPDTACPQNINVLNGIAYDPIEARLFVTGKLWCYLFEISLISQ
jgi:glutamine cyclotransferase